MLLQSFALAVISFTLVNAQISYTCNPSAPCGCSSQPAVISRVFGGETAVNNTWNWAVSILFNQSYFCGGVLISPSWVLTAANCVWVTRASEIWVSAGTSVLLGGKQVRTAAVVVKHPNFDELWWTNDIALIKVSSPFNMSDPSIGIICLPNATNTDWPPVNSSLVIVGWGGTNSSDGFSSSLQQATLQRVASNVPSCSTILMNETIQMCAAGMNWTKGVCSGDTGGPLMMFTPSQQWVLVGITSLGFGCFSTGWPSVHTRIIPYLNWIRSMNITGTVTAGSNDLSMFTTTTTASTTLPNQNRNSTQISTATHSFDSSFLRTLCLMTMFIYTLIDTDMFTFIFEY